MKRNFLNYLRKNIVSIKSPFVSVENERKKKWKEESGWEHEEKGN